MTEFVQKTITVDQLKLILERHAIVMQKTVNNRVNVGRTPELIVVQAINKILVGVPE